MKNQALPSGTGYTGGAISKVGLLDDPLGFISENPIETLIFVAVLCAVGFVVSKIIKGVK